MDQKELIKLLRMANCNITTRRLLVLACLAAQKHPVSIKQIVQDLHSKEIDQVTIYRTLALFKEKGIVNQIDLQEDKAYFELKDAKNDHHHIVCVACKKVEDFKGCNYESIMANILKHNRGFANITGHSFELFGVCASCAK